MGIKICRTIENFLLRKGTVITSWAGAALQADDSMGGRTAICSPLENTRYRIKGTRQRPRIEYAAVTGVRFDGQLTAWAACATKVSDAVGAWADAKAACETEEQDAVLGQRDIGVTTAGSSKQFRGLTQIARGELTGQRVWAAKARTEGDGAGTVRPGAGTSSKAVLEWKW